MRQRKRKRHSERESEGGGDGAGVEVEGTAASLPPLARVTPSRRSLTRALLTRPAARGGSSHSLEGPATAAHRHSFHSLPRPQHQGRASTTPTRQWEPGSHPATDTQRGSSTVRVSVCERISVRVCVCVARSEELEVEETSTASARRRTSTALRGVWERASE